MSTTTPTEALRRLVDVARLLDADECGELYNELQTALTVAGAVLAAPIAAKPSETAGQSHFIAMTESESFKYVLEQLASGNPNPKERRRLVREVRDTIKECATSQYQNSVEKLHGSAWIKIEDRLPDPYEEVRILFDGVPRIARLNHSRTYFQLCTFADSIKGQYIASFEKVAGWMRISLSPAPVAAVSAAPSGEVERDMFLHGVIAALGALAPHYKHGDTVHDEIVNSVGKEALYRAAEPEDIAWAALDPEYYAAMAKEKA